MNQIMYVVMVGHEPVALCTTNEKAKEAKKLFEGRIQYKLPVDYIPHGAEGESLFCVVMTRSGEVNSARSVPLGYWFDSWFTRLEAGDVGMATSHVWAKSKEDAIAIVDAHRRELLEQGKYTTSIPYGNAWAMPQRHEWIKGVISETGMFMDDASK